MAGVSRRDADMVANRAPGGPSAAGADINDFERALARFMSQHLASIEAGRRDVTAMLQLPSTTASCPSILSTFFAHRARGRSPRSHRAGHRRRGSVAASGSCGSRPATQQAVATIMRTVPMLRHSPRHIDRALTTSSVKAARRSH
jgi:hypothetical protein